MSAFDTYRAFKFVKMLSTSWEDWEAYKLGLIDDEGSRLKKAKSKDEKSAMNKMNVIAKNIKRILNKLPGGKSKFASIAASMFLLKEDSVPDDYDQFISMVEKEMNIDHAINESCNDFLPNSTAQFDGSMTDDLLNEDSSGVVVIQSIAYEHDGMTIYKVKDIVTREIMNLPGSALKEFK